MRVGQERFELSTPRLSSVCSNQLSYWPAWIGLSRPNSKPRIVGIDRNRLDRSRRLDSRKEVIQPQVPLRLPCYDLVPITGFIFGACLAAPATSDAPRFGGLTGGVYKAQEHIHRGVADPRLLAIPTSRRRVAAFDLNWGVLFGIGSPSRGCFSPFPHGTGSLSVTK